MNAFLRERLILVEKLFLIAVVSQDQTTAEAYSLELSSLIQHFKTVEASADLDDDTTLLLSRVSQAIRATTQFLLESEVISKDAQSRLTSCFSLLLPSDDLLPVSTSCPASTPHHLLFSHVSSSGTLGILGHNKLLDACAYRWLTQNIHNPYPTSTQLQIIADESMTSVAQAEFWFHEARGLIGWTRLSDEFFTGSLNATVTAAKQVYLEHDNTIPFCIAFAFSAVKASMETLFSERLVLPIVDLTHSNEEIEDTTPPPPVAGCKRNLPEDATTSLASNLHRPLKRLRAQSLHQVHSHSGSMRSLSNTSTSLKNSAAEALAHASAIPVTSIKLLDPSSAVGSSPDSHALNSTGQRQTDPYCDASKIVVVSPHPPVSQGQMRNQQIPESPPLVPSERQFGPSVNHQRQPSPGSVLTFAWPTPPSLDHPPTDPASGSQITVSPSVPVDLSVFDWNSIPDPLLETPLSINQPASVYVPSSDLAAMNCELTDPLYPEQPATQYNIPYSLDDLGSLEDFSFLQSPTPTTFSPDVSASHPASLCSDSSTFLSPEMDWSAITDFINHFSSFSTESSSTPSPSATFDGAPNTPENSISSLLPPPPHEVNKPISVLDSSIPPSVFLPAEPGIFTEDASSMWSLLCGPS